MTASSNRVRVELHNIIISAFWKVTGRHNQTDQCRIHLIKFLMKSTHSTMIWTILKKKYGKTFNGKTSTILHNPMQTIRNQTDGSLNNDLGELTHEVEETILIIHNNVYIFHWLDKSQYADDGPNVFPMSSVISAGKVSRPTLESPQGASHKMSHQLWHFSLQPRFIFQLKHWVIWHHEIMGCCQIRVFNWGSRCSGR